MVLALPLAQRFVDSKPASIVPLVQRQRQAERQRPMSTQ
jgi:hypothetical protein